MFCETLCGARGSAWYVFELRDATGSTSWAFLWLWVPIAETFHVKRWVCRVIPGPVGILHELRMNGLVNWRRSSCFRAHGGSVRSIGDILDTTDYV